MGGRRGDDLQETEVLKFPERRDQIPPVTVPRVAQGREPVMIHPRQFVKRAIPMRAMDFLLRQFDQSVEVLLVALLQQRIEQHGAERGRERERQARRHAVVPPALQVLEQRQIGFRDGLEEPALFQKFLVFGMAHERQSLQRKNLPNQPMA